MRRAFRLTLVLCLLPLITSCSDFAKGVTEAVLQNKAPKVRDCLVKGPAFDGILDSSDKETGNITKLMVVHGIGKHSTGYSTRLIDNLLIRMNLDIMDEDTRLIPIKDPQIKERILGYLQVKHFTNVKRDRHLIVYELTWSSYIEEKKKYLEYDDVSESAFMRAGLNSGIKKFFNERVTDPLIYLGEDGEGILASVSQSICWMLQPHWKTVGGTTNGYCDANALKDTAHIKNENYYFTTYSLGSHIVVRALEHMNLIAEKNGTLKTDHIHTTFKDKNLTVFMLANQLPLIQLGMGPSKIQGEIPRYCSAKGDRRADRWFERLSIVAFSDPNDLLSYTIPDGFENQFMDSRLCPKVTNVVIKVADEISLPVLGGFASPQSAHIDYDVDGRVINLMADGARRNGEEKDVPKSCRWIETTQE